MGRHDLYAFSMVSMPLAWSPCRWHDLHVFGMVSMPFAWFPCLQTYPFLTARILAFFAFWAFFATLTSDFGYGQTGDRGILRTVLKDAQMCWVHPLSMADEGPFHP